MQREEVIKASSIGDVLDAICKGRPIIFEAYSEYDSDIVKLLTKAELVQYIERKAKDKKEFVNLLLHYPETGGLVYKRKIDLIPESCNGATARYRVEGWGLIQAQLEFDKETIKCRFAVNSEKRALAWAEAMQELGAPDKWQWKVVESNARRLIRVLRKCVA